MGQKRHDVRTCCWETGPGRPASCRVVTSLQFRKKEKRKERNRISAKSNKANPRRRRCAFVYAMGTLSGAEELGEQVKYWFVSAGKPSTGAQRCSHSETLSQHYMPGSSLRTRVCVWTVYQIWFDPSRHLSLCRSVWVRKESLTQRRADSLNPGQWLLKAKGGELTLPFSMWYPISSKHPRNVWWRNEWRNKWASWFWEQF